MKKVMLTETEKFEKDSCITHEYPVNLQNMDACYAKVRGRNPAIGYRYNLECRELIYIISGSGEITTKDKTNSFQKGDVIVIEPLERYFWTEKCNCEMFITCNPNWLLDKCRFEE